MQGAAGSDHLPQRDVMSRLVGSDFLLYLDLTSWLVLLGIIFTWAMIDGASEVHNYRQEHVLRNGYYLLAKSTSLRQQSRNGMKWVFFFFPFLFLF